MSEFGDLVARQLKRRQLSAPDLAIKLDVDQSTIYRWIAGTSVPHVRETDTIAVALGVSESQVERALLNDAKVRRLAKGRPSIRELQREIAELKKRLDQ